MCETKIDKHVNPSEFLPPNYDGCIRKDRTSSGGGVMIAFKSHYVVDEVELPDVNCEIVWARMTLDNNHPMYVGSFYRPPGDSDAQPLEALEESLDTIANKCRNNTKTTITTGGDFNAGGIDWTSYTTTPECRQKSICEKVIDIFNKHGLTQLQESATRMGATLDLFGTNKPSLVKSIKTIPGISDHDILVIDTDIQARIYKKPRWKVYRWKRADWDTMKQATSDFSTSFTESSQSKSLDENYTAIEGHLKKMLDDYVPSRYTRTRTDLPWLSPELKKECRRKQRLYNKARKTGKPEDMKKYKEAQKITQKAFKQSRWRYINGLLQTGMDEGNCKPFWTYIRSQKQDNLGVSPLKKDGQLHPDHASKCEILADQFRSVFTKDSDDPHRNTRLFGPAYPPIHDLSISVVRVRKLLQGINPTKASGPDEIPCRLLRELATELAPAFTRLFTQTHESGQLPHNWTTAWISPVFKKGPRNAAENYRPVSVTCVICKVFEHILCSHIRGYLDDHGILTPVNHGFRRGHSCETQLLVTTHDITRRLDRREQVDMAVLDFSKAFDTVPHQRLPSKLEFCGITGRARNWIDAFLTSRTQSVMIEGHRSREDYVESGVPQGTVLGPLLFLIFVSDLPSVVHPHTALRLFADDCVIYRSISSLVDQLQLQSDLNALYRWGQCWGMQFNAKKCNIMRTGNVTRTFFYNINQCILEEVTQSTYLGVTITNNLSWSPHISSIVSKAHQRLGFIRHNLRGSPYKCREVAYKSLVRSQLEYSATIWDPTFKKDAYSLERVQNMSARWARGQYGLLSVTQLLRELHWASLADRRRHSHLILIFKILNGLAAVPPADIDIVLSERRHRKDHQKKIDRPRASHKHSPLWNTTSFRTIPEWNSLPANTAEADTLSSFKGRLAALSP